MPPTANTTIPASTPRITMTIMSSIRVKPSSCRALSIALCMTPPLVDQMEPVSLRASTSVSCGRGTSLPPSPAERFATERSCELHLLVDAVHRGDQRDRDEPHGDAHEDDHRGFEERRQALDLVLELLAVIVGAHAELFVQSSGVLAHLDHLDNGPREELRITHGPGEAFASHHRAV